MLAERGEWLQRNPFLPSLLLFVVGTITDCLYWEQEEFTRTCQHLAYDTTNAEPDAFFGILKQFLARIADGRKELEAIKQREAKLAEQERLDEEAAQKVG
jgi:hypothetical protein